MNKGIVFDIQRFAVHDGPGIRTNVFFKGCPIHCAWCCNPESQHPLPEIGYTVMSCIGCGACTAACPNDAISLGEDGRRIFDFPLCRTCQDKPCVSACSARAIKLFGEPMSIDEILAEVEKDREFYIESGGGVTVSGGEPLVQVDFVSEFLAACRAEGYTTAMETCGHVSFSAYEKVMPLVDDFLCDIKHIDPVRFKEWTGGNLNLILDNLRKLAAHGCRITARVPVIPGFNDDPETILGICQFAKEIGLQEVNLLPYHRLGKAKYEKLGLDYPMGEAKVPDEAGIHLLAEAGRVTGLTISVGG